MKRVLLACTLCLTVLAAHAAPTLPERYFAELKAIEADFTQTVYDADDSVVETSSGTMSLAKPGLFRWDYETPFPQLIVGDGQKVWHYDPELAQVTVKGMDEVLAQAPTALLNGDAPLGESFAIEAQGDEGGLSWFRLTPRDDELSPLRIAFDNDDQLAALELSDALGQRTRLDFTAVQPLSSVPAGRFAFEPPAGTDVIGG